MNTSTATVDTATITELQEQVMRVYATRIAGIREGVLNTLTTFLDDLNRMEVTDETYPAVQALRKVQHDRFYAIMAVSDVCWLSFATPDQARASYEKLVTLVPLVLSEREAGELLFTLRNLFACVLTVSVPEAVSTVQLDEAA